MTNNGVEKNLGAGPRSASSAPLAGVEIYVDLDDTVLNTTEPVLEGVAKLDADVIARKPELKKLLKTKSCSEIAVNENFPNILLRMKPYYAEIFKNQEAEEGAVAVIQNLRAMGASIYGITARSAAIISDEIVEITTNRAKELSIEFDEIYFEQSNKSSIRKLANTENCVFIDDSLKHCREVQSVMPGILNINYDRRSDMPAPEGVYKAKSWSEIGKKIFEYYNLAG